MHTIAVRRGKKEITATESTPLRVGELAQYFRCSRWKIEQEVKRGYRLLYGNETTPAHYRAWRAANPAPRKVRQAPADQQRLERELSQLP